MEKTVMMKVDELVTRVANGETNKADALWLAEVLLAACAVAEVVGDPGNAFLELRKALRG